MSSFSTFVCLKVIAFESMIRHCLSKYSSAPPVCAVALTASCRKLYVSFRNNLLLDLLGLVQTDYPANAGLAWLMANTCLYVRSDGPAYD